MSTSIGDAVSRIRGGFKIVKEDAFITDRYIYSIILKYAKALVRRQDTENKIMRFQSLFEPVPCIDLIEVDKVSACCQGISSKCIIRRTNNRLPTLLEGAYGPIIRSVTSLDGSINVFKTIPSIYANMTKLSSFKYNTNKYYWYLDGYLYFPNLEWEGVSIEGLWDDNINFLKCDADDCYIRQNDPTHFPEYLFAEIENLVRQEMSGLSQMPPDKGDDSQNTLR